MTTFRRAHSPEQREVRRQAILDTAVEMLQEMPVAAISLNELSRRVGLAKSNVLRYFESREAVLLEVFNSELSAWVEHLRVRFGDQIDTSADVDRRGTQVIDTIVASLVERPTMCDLMSEQAAVLEHNISTEAVLQFKRVSTANIGRLVELIVSYLPELGQDAATRFTMLAAVLASSIWAHSHPSAALLAAYAADPGIACYRIEFAPALADALHIMLAGLLVSSP